MSIKFYERVMNSVYIDTKKYRYISREGRDGVVYILRLPIKYLDTTKALTDWELVRTFY